MIVELLGPPGAGKSALLPAATRELARWSGRICEPADQAVDRHLHSSTAGRLLAPLLGGRPRRLRALLVDVPYGLAFMLSRPRLTLSAAAAIRLAPVGWGHRWTLLMRWAGVAARQHFLRGRIGAEIVIFDEGLYHRAVNLFAWRSTSDRQRPGSIRGELQAYLRAAPAPDVAIFVDAADEVTGQRLAARGLPLRLRGWSPVQVAAFLASAGQIARAIPAETADRTRWLWIENASTLDAAGRELAAALRLLVPPLNPAAPAGWPIEPPRRAPSLRRPDRWWRSRPHPLDVDQRLELQEVMAALGIETVRGARSIGAGRSWNVVADTNRGRLVLKRYKPSVENEAITTEHGVLRRLDELHLPAPRLVAGPDGTTAVRRDGASFAAFQHVAGHLPMHELVTLPASRRRLACAAGIALAVLHVALADHPPAGFPSTGLGPHGMRQDPSADHAERLRHGATALSVSGRSMAALADRVCELDARLVAASLQTTLVHGDYGPYNLLVRPGEPLLVVDFELSRLDWRLLDLVTAAPRFAVSRAGFSADRFAAFLSGYLKRAPDMRSELAIAPALLEFLNLRRAAVCLRRHADSPSPALLREAADCVKTARSLVAGTHRLIPAFETAWR